MQKGTSEKRFRLILWSGSNRVVTSMHSKHRYIKRKKENYRYVLWMSFIILWMIMNTLTRAKSFILESFFFFLVFMYKRIPMNGNCACLHVGFKYWCHKNTQRLSWIFHGQSERFDLQYVLLPIMDYTMSVFDGGLWFKFEGQQTIKRSNILTPQFPHYDRKWDG